MPRGRKKTKKKKEETIEVVKEEKKERKQAVVPFDVFCSIKGIKETHKAGMAAYKNAKDLKLTLKDWEKHFETY